MKRAVILHGTDGNPEINWLPWVRRRLEDRGYEVFVPLLPNSHTPNRKVYDDYLRLSGWDFQDNLIIGHSSGATTVLNLLMSDWFPHVDKTILIGTFLNERLLDDVSWYEKGQFDRLFPEKFAMSKIKNKSSDFVFIHGINDPYCSYDDARQFCKDIGGELVEVENGLHLSSNRKELPEIIPFI